MLPEIVSAFALLAVCVVIHAAGVTWLAKYVAAGSCRLSPGPWSSAWLLIRTAWALAALHICEILVWAAYFTWEGCLPDFKTSTYYSGVSYTTIGYGDVVLPRRWWFLGPMEGLTGILMCGISTGFFFIVVSRLFTVRQMSAGEKHSLEPNQNGPQ